MVRIIKVCHADDHAIVCEAVERILTTKTSHIQVVDTASSFQQLIPILEQQEIDVLLLDGVIIGGKLEDYLPFIRSKYPTLKIILLWVFANENSLLEWFHLIDGHLNLNVGGAELIQAIEAVYRGEKYFTLPVYFDEKKRQ
jgi:DNA-binding NarL/FixJ family response regulator